MEELHQQNALESEEESSARCVHLAAITLSDNSPPSLGLTLRASFDPIIPFLSIDSNKSNMCF